MPKKEKKFRDLDKFIEWFTVVCPSEVHLVKDQERYDRAIKAITTICNFALESNPGETFFTVDQDALLGTSLCVEIISDMLIFKDVRTLREVVADINPDEIIYEIVVRTDGKFSLGISFDNIFDLAPPEDSPFPEYEKGYGQPIIKRKMK